MKLKVYSLATELDAASVYSDYSIPKSQLTDVLESARTTIYDWYKLAWDASSEFRKDTPRFDDGSYDKAAPLPPYQIWLLSRVKAMMLRLKKSESVKAYMKGNPELFSKERFLFFSAIVKEKTA